MKANELMVGDYLMHNGLPYRVIQVDGIVRDGWILENGEEDCGEPIPITADILEKNGFDTLDPEVKQYHFTEDGQSYHFSLRQMYSQKNNKPNGYSFYAFGVLTIIDYVHQLQHALRLCGIKKEIEL